MLLSRHNYLLNLAHYMYSDVIMSATASQSIGVSIVYKIVCSGVDQRNLKGRVTGLCEGNSPVTREFPTQRASNTKNHADVIKWNIFRVTGPLCGKFIGDR